MDSYVCHHCMWEGTQENLKVSMDSNPHNNQDHSLYENLVCPDCSTNDLLVNISEEQRYEDMAHWNYYKNQE